MVTEAAGGPDDFVRAARNGSHQHIILFSDVADIENPDNYKSVVEACVRAGTSISVVGLETDKDVDAEQL